MPNCAIINCKNSTKLVSRVNGDISFHAFPNEPYLKGKWIDATGNKNWFPTKYSRICSIHFDKDSFSDSTTNRRLSKTAYPTLHVLQMSNEEDIDQPSTSKNTPLNASEKRKQAKKLNFFQQKIKEKDRLIKILREQNRRKAKKILALVAIIEQLKKNSFNNEKVDTLRTSASTFIQNKESGSGTESE